MIIPIDDRYRLLSDASQWMIQKSRTKKGKQAWESFKFFHNPSNVVGNCKMGDCPLHSLRLYQGNLSREMPIVLRHNGEQERSDDDRGLR